MQANNWHVDTGPALMKTCVWRFPGVTWLELVRTVKVHANENVFFVAEFERAAKIRKIAVYRSLISLLVPELQRFKD